MIIGAGIDLVEIERVTRILQGDAGRRFIERILTPEEHSLLDARYVSSRREAEFVAGRFAAKEAVVKALGCGIGREAGFQDIIVMPNQAGQPQCELSEAMRSRLGLDEKVRVHLSITHTSLLASAYAVAEKVTEGS